MPYRLRGAVFVVLLCAPLPVNAQHQEPKYQTGWPCVGKVDPAYVRTSEATGGKVLLLQPQEVSGAADDMSLAQGHRETVFRSAGQLDEGVHDFDIPLDSTIESVYFFVSLQCLQFVTIVQPSGVVLQTDDSGVDSRAFEAIRMFKIKAPAPGTWRVTVSGHGFSLLIVNAKTDLALTAVSFSQNGAPVAGLAPLGQLVRLEANVSGRPRDVDFQFISMQAAMLQTIELALEQEAAARSTYAADVTLPKKEFHVLMSGVDSNGYPFQRVSHGLFVGDR